jgi:putative transposase
MQPDMDKVELRDDKKAVDLPGMAFEAYVQRGQITGVAELAPSGLSAEAKEMLARASREDFKEANRRLRIIKPDLDGREPTEEERAEYDVTPDRTRREWKKHFRAAERQYGAGYLGLLPVHWRKGRHGDRLGARREMMNEFILTNYETKKQKTIKAVYIAFKIECRKNGIIPPSEKAFRDAIKRRPRRQQIQKRQGHRAAYQEKEFCYYLGTIVPQHGDRPFHIGHVDHTPLDLELHCARTGRNLGKAWLTLLIDAFSRRILAIWISFDPPSYRSCMMILRICVKRWNRLPQILVVDGGKEFQSVYFEAFLAYYGITKRTRPPAEPRYGSVIERIFETTNEQFIYNLIGNTQVMKNVRQVTKEVNPKNLAVWTLDQFFGGLCEYCYEVYDTKPHSTLGQSPRDAYEQGRAWAGIRPHRLIQYDEDFEMMTLPTTRKSTALVQPGQGVKINYFYYWSDAFRDRDVERTQVEVRFDPFDLGIAYAFVKGQWVQCISSKYGELQGRSEREVMLLTQEFRRRQRLDDEEVAISEQRLAEFIVRMETHEVILQQRLRDEASMDVLAIIEGRSREESNLKSPHHIVRPSDSHDSAQSLQFQLLEDTEIDANEIYDDF